MTSMLHALASTFTTCACGARARDCALTRLAEFVDGTTGIPPTPSPSPPSQFAFSDYRHGPVSSQSNPNSNSHLTASSYINGHSRNKDGEREPEKDKEKEDGEPTNLGPLVGVARGFRTRERVPGSGGMCGMEVVRDGLTIAKGWEGARLDGDGEMEAGPSRSSREKESAQEGAWERARESPARTYDRKGKGRAVEGEEQERPVGEWRCSVALSQCALPGSGLIFALVENRRARRRAQTQPKGRSTRSRSRSPPRVVPEKEGLLPPKLRKRWIRASAEGLKETGDDASARAEAKADLREDVDMGVSEAVGAGPAIAAGLGYEPPRAPDADWRAPVRPPDEEKIDGDGDVDMDEPTVAVDGAFFPHSFTR